MTYILYRQNNSKTSDAVEALLSQQGVVFIAQKTCEIQLTKQQVTDLLDLLGMWAIDLVERSHPLWIDGCLNEESDDNEIIEFVVANPEVMIDAIVVKDASRAIIANPPENIFSLF